MPFLRGAPGTFNLRLTEPDRVAKVPIDRFEGLNSFEDLQRDGRCVSDYWF